jgi:hypothetical protein
MQHIGQSLSFTFLPVASNDNEDLLSFSIPSADLSFVQSIKHELQLENAVTGMLLHSKKSRKFFQEVVDAERYIMMRYFSANPCEQAIRELKRHILDEYLFPKKKRGRKKKQN